ncbi:MAG: PTS transporter subunit EIIC [Bacteroidales bacterium]|nr:PTS transporter subunit EIIC [Bacteroidales bacterium]MCM1416474.1 PTS transporter subunit EIIC [bacterium]MCM1424580.1 PTS transporter subunit EIIC [bacterium]
MINKCKKGLLAVFDHVTACMLPIIPLLLAGGILKIIVMLLTAVHILSGSTEVILSALATTPFYFLPVFVAYSAAKHFETDPLLALASVCVMLLPDFAALMESGERVTFAGIPVVAATYAYNVIPIILLIYCMSWIVKWLKKLIRESLQPYFLAVCAIAVTSLLGILVIEPIVSLLSGLLADGLEVMQFKAPMIAWAVFAALTTLLVSTGMHWIFITLAITQIGVTGVDYGIMVGFLISNISLAGCDLAVFVKSKTAEKKAMSLSAMITEFASGVAEPSIFGVCFQEKTPMIGNVLGCAVAGVVQGILTVHCYTFAFPCIPTILMFYSAEEPNNLWKAVIVAAAAFAASFVITALVYHDKEKTTD